ncbi:MAG TPA: (Fe-S)-binding protein [Myxococcota bacterium]|jgi:Fe-S oxidoreductase|nr:(Fe-S)-binding protein [Myxococcota bacterium]
MTRPPDRPLDTLDPRALLAATLGRHHRAIDLCVYCPKLCRHVCPVAVEEGSELSTPWGLMTMLGLVRDGLEAPSPEWGAALAHCTTCGRCRDACLHGNDVTEPILAGRALAQIVAAAPPAAVAAVEGFAARSARLAARAEALAGPATASSRIAYLPGCAALEADPDGVRRALRVLARLGVEDVTLFGPRAPGGACCGGPLRDAGAADAFRAHARGQHEALRAFDLVVADDPACAAALRAGRPSGARTPVVRTAAELLAELVEGDDESESGAGGGAPAVLHVACQARRDGAPAAAARRLVAACGLDAAALPDGDRASACCGAGALLPETVPETARALASHVGAEAERARRGAAARAGGGGGRGASGGAPLVTTSPRCAVHLRSAGVAVRTLWEIVEEALGA